VSLQKGDYFCFHSSLCKYLYKHISECVAVCVNNLCIPIQGCSHSNISQHKDSDVLLSCGELLQMES
jgi:hypothetical protein